MVLQSSKYCTVLLVLLSILVLHVYAQQRRLEYKYSFKPPFLTKSDGTIPFWSYSGHAIASDDYIRITPSLRNRHGQAWTTNATTFENWEIEVAFRVTGRGRLGADGIAIWYTAQPGQEGPVFGSSDKWVGLGIFLDSYDNDQQHNNPALLAVVNDGMRRFDHDGDGASQSLGMCVRDFRNKPNPIRVRVQYYQRRLTVSMTNGLSEFEQFEPCLESAELLSLPSSGYFGLSAATGALADDHDVQSFITHSLTDPDAKPQAGAVQPVGSIEKQAPAISTEERSKFEKEFRDFIDKVKDARLAFEKEHGTSTTPSPEDLYETEADRNVRQILALQSQTVESLRQLRLSLDQLKLMSNSGTEPGSVLQSSLSDLVSKQDLQSMQTALNSLLIELRNSLSGVQRKLDSTAQVDSAQDRQTISKQLNDVSHGLSSSMNALRDEVQKLVRSNVQGQQGVQPVCSCVSSTFLIVLLFLQTGVFIAFEIYQKNRETRAKKFY